MRTRHFWGWATPAGVSALLFLSAVTLADDPSIRWGMIWGTAIALIQTFASTGAMKWAWHKKSFYWVWGGGMLGRLLILALTAFVVYQYTDLNIVATLITLVSASTLFLVVEYYGFLVSP